MLSIPHGHLATLRLAIAHDEHIWDFLQLCFANLQIHFFVTVVYCRPDTGCPQALMHLARVFKLAVRDRQNDSLHRC